MSATNEEQASVQISNKYGLHARPAAEFVKLANRFSADIWVRKHDMEVNGKSIMGMMMLAAEYGSEITIRASGTDSEEALNELVQLVEGRFGEE